MKSRVVRRRSRQGVEGLGCKAIRVHTQEEIAPAIKQAEAWMAQYQVPVVIEIILEARDQHRHGQPNRKTWIEFEETCRGKADVADRGGAARLVNGLSVSCHPSRARISVSEAPGFLALLGMTTKLLSETAMRASLQPHHALQRGGFLDRVSSARQGRLSQVR